MKNLAKENLVNSLVIAVINPDYYHRKVFAMFLVEEQDNEVLHVLPVWDMDNPDHANGWLDGRLNSVRLLRTDEIWSFVTSLTEVQKVVLARKGVTYRFYTDADALPRLVEKLDLEKMNIGFDGEDADGSWFTCLRIPRMCVPAGLYVYSLRESDADDALPASIESKVYINHFGDILTDRELPVPITLPVDYIPRDEEGNIIGC